MPTARAASVDVLVVTVVHNPDDARILHRQIRALLDAGHRVVYAAPFSGYRTTPWPQVHAVDVPRARGRRRLRALLGARRVLREHGPRADLVLLHDPELLLAAATVRLSVPIVWDVHEDTGAALSLKPWMPSAVRPLVRRCVGLAERVAERRGRLLLAETGYAERFSRQHPVVPNSVLVPTADPAPPGDERVVYVGALSHARGAADMVALGQRLKPRGIRVQLVGTADSSTELLLRDAVRAGHVEWLGFRPNDVARASLDGALAGLSLLHDEPNYAHSQPTKILEYMAHGIPVVTTPNASSVRLVQRHACGHVVPFEDPGAAAAAVLALHADPDRRVRLGLNGRRGAQSDYDWRLEGPRFAALLESWALGETVRG